MKTFLFEYITSEKIIFSGQVQEVLVPTELGIVGIRAGHADMVANITLGKIVIDNKREFEVKAGFLEVKNLFDDHGQDVNCQVTVLA